MCFHKWRYFFVPFCHPSNLHSHGNNVQETMLHRNISSLYCKDKSFKFLMILLLLPEGWHRNLKHFWIICENKDKRKGGTTNLIPLATWYGVVFQDSPSTIFPSGRVILIGCGVWAATQLSYSSFNLFHNCNLFSRNSGGGVIWSQKIRKTR